MHNEQRIVELLAETLIKFDSMIDEQKQTNKRLEKLEDGVAKLNAQTSENTRAVMKLANEFEQVLKLNERVTKLEHTVYK
jgi:predicted RNase H-like nuclease (RuvC/YqgF family)